MIIDFCLFVNIMIILKYKTVLQGSSLVTEMKEEKIQRMFHHPFFHISISSFQPFSWLSIPPSL